MTTRLKTRFGIHRPFLTLSLAPHGSRFFCRCILPSRRRCLCGRGEAPGGRQVQAHRVPNQITKGGQALVRPFDHQGRRLILTPNFSMHYTGTLLADGSKFDSSLDRDQ